MVAPKALIKSSMDNGTQHVLVTFSNGRKLKISVKRVLSLNGERFCALLEECLYPEDSVVFQLKSGHFRRATVMSSEEPDKQVASAAVRSWKRKEYQDFLLDSPILPSSKKKAALPSETPGGKKKSVDKEKGLCGMQYSRCLHTA